MDTVRTFTWEFGGPLAGLPLALGFILLSAVFAVGAGIILWSYQSTLQQLTLWRRVTLIALRIGLLATLLLFLANPTRVERVFLGNDDDATAVLLVDHSASMTTADNRGHSRLDYAARTWRQFAGDIGAQFENLQTVHFDAKTRPAGEGELYPAQSPGAAETALLASMQAILDNEKPAALFIITDGLDTGPAPTDEQLAAIEQGGARVSFITGENRQSDVKELKVRSLEAPSEVLRETAFPVSVVVEARLPASRNLPVRLTMDGQPVFERELPLAAGYHLLPINAELLSGAPGERLLELTVGAGESARTFRRIVRVVKQQTTRVLYYQGTPDWGFRFTSAILSREPSIEITSIFKPTADVTVTLGQDELEDLPTDPNSLRGFDVVLLSQVPASQLTVPRQQALKEYVRAGGGLLILLPDEQQTNILRESELEEIMPVYLEKPGGATTTQVTLDQQMQRIRQNRSGQFVQLEPFLVNKDSPFAYIFQNAEADDAWITPKFASSSPLFRAKAGADVLAYHPLERDPTGRRGILLSLQRFGQGYTAVLATDSLWRWKLNEPSDFTGPEQFWQQLLHAVAGPPDNALHYERPPVEVAHGQGVTLELAGVPNDAEAVTATAINPKGESIELLPGAGARPDRREVRWTPDVPGDWTLTAMSGESEARQIIRVAEAEEALPDRAHEGVDYELMRRLAVATGGEILEPGAQPAWLERADDGPELLSEQHQPLWRGWPFWLLTAAFYSSELIFRRRWKLL